MEAMIKGTLGLDLPEYPPKPELIIPKWYPSVMVCAVIIVVFASSAMLGLKRWDWGAFTIIAIVGIVGALVRTFTLNSDDNFRIMSAHNQLCDEIRKQRAPILHEASEQLRQRRFAIKEIDIVRINPLQRQICFDNDGIWQTGIFQHNQIELVGNMENWVIFPDLYFDDSLGKVMPYLGERALVSCTKSVAENIF